MRCISLAEVYGRIRQICQIDIYWEIYLIVILNFELSTVSRENRLFEFIGLNPESFEFFDVIVLDVQLTFPDIAAMLPF